MKVLLSLCLFVVAGTLTTGALAQSSSLAVTPNASGEVIQADLPVVSTGFHPFFAANPQEESLMEFYDETKPKLAWPVFAQVGDALPIMYGERFTLPGSGGSVSIIYVAFQQWQGDTIYVDIVEDSLYDLGGTILHLPLEGRVLGTQAIFTGDIPTKNGTATFEMPNVRVGKEFHIIVRPRLLPNNQYSSAYQILSDNKTGREVTTETARSTFIGVINQSLQKTLLDGRFTLTGQSTPVNPDLYIAAIVDAYAASVRELPESSVTLYPNPVPAGASARLALEELHNVHVTIFDVLGNEVLELKQPSTSRLDLNTHSLAPGAYRVVADIDGAKVSRLLIVE